MSGSVLIGVGEHAFHPNPKEEASMSDSRSLTRLPVYDVSNGRVVGRVHRLIVDPDSRKVAGLLLATRLGREARCLPFRNIHAIGRHAVTVRGTDAIARLSELPDMEEMFRSRRRVHDSPVLTEDGTFVGDVDEYAVNTQTGRIETLLLSGGLVRELFRRPTDLSAHYVVTIGEDAVIVREQAVTTLQQTATDGGPSAAWPAPKATQRPAVTWRLFGLLGRRPKGEPNPEASPEDDGGGD